MLTVTTATSAHTTTNKSINFVKAPLGMTTTDIINISVELVIGLAAVVGNSLVVVAVITNKHLRTVTNYFIVSLALADFLVGLVALPCAITSYTGHPYNDFYGCLLINSIVVMLTQSSIFSLLAIALERYAAIKHPFVYTEWCTSKVAITVIVFTWLASLIIGLVPMFGWHGTLPKDGRCAFTQIIDMKYMVYFNFFGCVLIPLIIIFAIYAYIFYTVKKQSRQIAALEIGNFGSNESRLNRHSKAAKSLATVCALFAICWLPIHILNTLAVVQRIKYPYELLLAAVLLSHANSAVNPIIYALGCSGFRHAFKNLLCCRKSTNRDHSRLGTVFGNDAIAS